MRTEEDKEKLLILENKRKYWESKFKKLEVDYNELCNKWHKKNLETLQEKKQELLKEIQALSTKELEQKQKMVKYSVFEENKMYSAGYIQGIEDFKKKIEEMFK